MKPLIQTPSRHSGFTLLEALIALVVVATGLLALAQFHSAVLLGSADAKARSQAADLAQSKMDELRTYYAETTFSALADSTSAETAATTGSDINVSGMDWVESFSRTWTVTGEYIDTYICDSATVGCPSKEQDPLPPPCTCPDGVTIGPPCPCPDTSCTLAENCHLKRIETAVSWTDARGVAQSINLESIIEGIDPIYSGLALGNTTPSTAGP